MKKVFAAKYLSVALAVAAFAAASSVSAFAQSRSHDGSLLPHYFDPSGDLIWGSWAAANADQQAELPSRNQQAGRPPSRNQQAALPSRHLYLYARSRSSHARNS